MQEVAELLLSFRDKVACLASRSGTANLESWHSGNPHGPCCRDTYKGLIDVLPDIRHYLGIVATGQDGVQGMLLDGLQQASRVPKPKDAGFVASQPFHQIIHSNVGRGTTQDLQGKKPSACYCQGQQNNSVPAEDPQQREGDQHISMGNKPLTSPQPPDTTDNSHLALKH